VAKSNQLMGAVGVLQSSPPGCGDKQFGAYS